MKNLKINLTSIWIMLFWWNYHMWELIKVHLFVLIGCDFFIFPAIILLMVIWYSYHIKIKDITIYGRINFYFTIIGFIFIPLLGMFKIVIGVTPPGYIYRITWIILLVSATIIARIYEKHNGKKECQKNPD